MSSMKLLRHARLSAISLEAFKFFFMKCTSQNILKNPQSQLILNNNMRFLPNAEQLAEGEGEDKVGKTHAK